jgi:transaldolase / glucose-6-phosphate isomerase
MSSTPGPSQLVERIWARDPTLWTSADEGQWLGWLDEPLRMESRLGELERFAADVAHFDDCVLLGMGGSSLAPEVFRRTHGLQSFHVLDSTHPAAIRRVEQQVALERTLFIAASKSGTTLETRCHTDYFWERCGGRGDQFVAITDPGSPLEELARQRGFRAVFAGEPTIGGRYSALSPFGIVPAVLMREVRVDALLADAQTALEECRGMDANGALELGLRLGEGWRHGQDKVCLDAHPLALWVEQLLAESTGKEGKGLVPAPGENPDGADRLYVVLHRDGLGGAFYRWEFATAVAGAIMGINPFDQPNVQQAKDRTNAVLDAGEEVEPDREGSVDELLAQAREGDYVCVQAFIDPEREAELDPLVARARETGCVVTGCVVTKGLGPRYLHSTGQLHKGGPNTGLFIQVVDDAGDEVPIPGQPFGFRRLIRAQAAGDYASLRERGRRVVRVRLEEL